MIIHLLGTNGAGKSTLVRGVMGLFPHKRELMDATGHRRKPIGYVLSGRAGISQELYVPGHYEIQNGGVDTLRSLDEAYMLIRAHAMRRHVIFEGKNLSDSPQRLLAIAHTQKIDCRAVLIDLPLEECIRAVRARGHSIKRETIERLWHKSHSHLERLKECGVVTEKLSRDAAHRKVVDWLFG